MVTVLDGNQKKCGGWGGGNRNIVVVVVEVKPH